MKAIFLLFFVILFCGGCVNQGDFGAKFCSVYQSYDSAAPRLQKHLSRQEDSEAIYWMFLGIAEMYRGEIPAMHRAFQQAERKESFPELYLFRCNWNIESGNLEKAEADLHRAKELIAGLKLEESLRLQYYRFCAVRRISGILYSEAIKIESKKGYPEILRITAEKMNEKLAVLKASNVKGLFAFRDISDPSWKKLVFGMTEEEIFRIIGKPVKVIDGDQRKLLIYVKENQLAGFYFSVETKRLGQIRTFPVCSIHGVEPMRLFNYVYPSYFTRKELRISVYKRIYYNETYCFISKSLSPFDFQWVCLKCLKKKVDSFSVPQKRK